MNTPEAGSPTIIKKSAFMTENRIKDKSIDKSRERKSKLKYTNSLKIDIDEENGATAAFELADKSTNVFM